MLVQLLTAEHPALSAKLVSQTDKLKMVSSPGYIKQKDSRLIVVLPHTIEPFQGWAVIRTLSNPETETKCGWLSLSELTRTYGGKWCIYHKDREFLPVPSLSSWMFHMMKKRFCKIQQCVPGNPCFLSTGFHSLIGPGLPASASASASVHVMHLWNAVAHEPVKRNTMSEYMIKKPKQP